MSTHDKDPFGVTPPDAYNPPAADTPRDEPEAFRPDLPAPPRYDTGVHEPARFDGAPNQPPPLGEPIVAGEPAPALAGGPPPSRGAMDASSMRFSRVAEEFVAWLKTLASAAVYATLIVTFGFQVARVEGQSMAPTLQNQDRLIVNKFAYRFSDPQVGDIVMLYYPSNPDKSFVKRVIAAEHDQVRIVDGKVYRNDILMDDSFVPPEYRSHEDWGPEVVPEGYYFVMGDHRNNSSDSRHWKWVPKKYIIGKVQIRWWPLPEATIF
jgi:signal peptidase I